MCGIAGLWDRDLPDVDALQARTAAMTQALAHRGPDAHGVWTDAAAGIGLGHRRLSILDLSPSGAQPMASACGRYVITYNGELYNAPALSQELATRGASYRGTSDTEVLLHAIVAYGLEEALKRSVGMFAFALWDRHERTLTLARDRVGKKPLFWYRRGPLVLFGSEIKALLAHPDFERELDPTAIAGYLRFAYVPAPLSIFAGVEKVPPGAMLELRQDGSIRQTVYWDLARAAEARLNAPRAISEDEAIAEADALLRDAVLKRTLSDVPLGVFLSGGVDSSLVTALLQAQMDKPVRTFSAGFVEKSHDESSHARAIASHLGTDHTELTVTPDETLAVVPRLTEWFDEPFADSSQIPTHLLSALTRQYVTVALSGDGGDEIAAGYVRHGAVGYWWPKVSLLPTALRKSFAGALDHVSPSGWDTFGAMLPASLRPAHIGDKAGKFAHLLRADNPTDAYRSLVSHWDRPRDLIAQAREAGHPMDQTNLAKRFPDPTARYQYLDMASYLPDDILCKVDRASMAVALEVRCPLLDHRVIEYFWSLPRHYLRQGNRRKVLLKRVLARYVQPALFERPKMGFAVPVGAWLRGPLRDWAEDLLSEQRLRRENLFDPAPIRQVWAEHLSGRADHDQRLWIVLMFQSWRERWLSASRANPLPAPAKAPAVAHTYH